MTMHTRVERGFRVLLSLAVQALVGAAVTFRRPPAAGLSCAQIAVEEWIARAPVPFIGRFFDSESEGGHVATFSVEDSLRVELPDTVTVGLSDISGAAGSGSVLAYPTNCPEGPSRIHR